MLFIAFTFLSLSVGSQGLCRFMKESSPSAIPEGEEAVYSVELLSQPPAGVNVSIVLTPLDSRVNITSGNNILFNSSNWDQRQRIVLFGTNDNDILDSPYASEVRIQSYSNSLNFSTSPGGSFPSGDVTLLLQDTDRGKLIVTTKISNGLVSLNKTLNTLSAIGAELSKILVRLGGGAVYILY